MHTSFGCPASVSQSPFGIFLRQICPVNDIAPLKPPICHGSSNALKHAILLWRPLSSIYTAGTLIGNWRQREMSTRFREYPIINRCLHSMASEGSEKRRECHKSEYRRNIQWAVNANDVDHKESRVWPQSRPWASSKIPQSSRSESMRSFMLLVPDSATYELIVDGKYNGQHVEKRSVPLGGCGLP